jgi:hypothetical protein
MPEIVGDLDVCPRCREPREAPAAPEPESGTQETADGTDTADDTADSASAEPESQATKKRRVPNAKS